MYPAIRQLPPFRLIRPSTIEEALSALGSEEVAPVCYAGGTDLVLSTRQGLAIAALLAIAGVDELKAVRVSDDQLSIGALASLDQLSNDATLDRVPGLRPAFGTIANSRIRLRASIGGNLMARRTAYEAAIFLMTLEARLIFATPAGRQEMPVPALWEVPPPERSLLTSINIPLAGAPRLDYDRSLRPWMTQAAAHVGDEERCCVATRFLQPALVRDNLTADPMNTLDALPDNFSDFLVTRTYVIEAASSILVQQRGRLAGGIDASR